jgi:hypothetical protein
MRRRFGLTVPGEVEAIGLWNKPPGTGAPEVRSGWNGSKQLAPCSFVK